MRIERHVFGSVSGYRTLARSAGVSADDAARLEADAFAFGQTADAGYARSLATSPAYFTRVLGGGERRGVTRVFDGGADDNGRPTLRMVTLIVARRNWDGELYGDVGQLLRHPGLWAWDGGPAIAALDVAAAAPERRIAAASAPRVLGLLSAIERAAAGGGGVIVSAAQFSAAEVAAVEMLLPLDARRRVTTGYRTLGAGLQVTLNALAGEASQRKVNYRFDAADAAAAPYAAYLGRTQLTGGVLPLAEVMGYVGFGMGGVGAAAAVAAAVKTAASAAASVGRSEGVRVATEVKRGARPPYAMIVGVSVLTALVGVGVSALIWSRRGPVVVDGGAVGVETGTAAGATTTTTATATRAAAAATATRAAAAGAAKAAGAAAAAAKTAASAAAAAAAKSAAGETTTATATRAAAAGAAKTAGAVAAAVKTAAASAAAAAKTAAAAGATTRPTTAPAGGPKSPRSQLTETPSAAVDQERRELSDVVEMGKAI